MLAANKRADGRWDTYGQSPEIGKSEQNMRSICGVIADHAPLSLCAAPGRVNGSRWGHPTRAGS